MTEPNDAPDGEADSYNRTVSERGQVTIPKDIRVAYGFLSGTDVIVREEDGRVVIEQDDLDEQLAKGYQARKEQSEELQKQWKETSKEANKFL